LTAKFGYFYAADNEVGIDFFKDFFKGVIYNDLQGIFLPFSRKDFGRTVGIRIIRRQNTLF